MCTYLEPKKFVISSIPRRVIIWTSNAWH